MHRSEITIDLGALRRNVRTLLERSTASQLWAVVKATPTATARSTSPAGARAGATALCVATVGEGFGLRSRAPRYAHHRHGAHS